MRLSAFFRPRITLEQLSQFCGNLATCVSAGLDIPRSLTTCLRSLPCPVLREILVRAASQTAKGMQLFRALERDKSCFPAFFVPVVRCGEESGHLDRTLRYLESHCRLLAEPTRVMRNTWLVPLCLMLGGTVVCSSAYWVFAPRPMAMRYLIDSLKFYAVLAVAVGAALWAPPIRSLVDELRLALPVIGPAERELAINRFFHAMNALYAAGGRRVEDMIRLAADSAENTAIRADFRRAAEVIESGGTFSEAFFAVKRLPFDYKTEIATGDEAGKLEAAFARICQASGESVQSLLRGFQAAFFRIVTLAVILSISATFFTLASLRR